MTKKDLVKVIQEVVRREVKKENLIRFMIVNLIEIKIYLIYIHNLIEK